VLGVQPIDFSHNDLSCRMTRATVMLTSPYYRRHVMRDLRCASPRGLVRRLSRRPFRRCSCRRLTSVITLLCLPLPFPSPATLLPQDPASRVLGLIARQQYRDCGGCGRCGDFPTAWAFRLCNSDHMWAVCNDRSDVNVKRVNLASIKHPSCRNGLMNQPVFSA
jgi:hypothetical protein